MIYTNNFDEGITQLERKVAFLAFPIIYSTKRLLSIQVKYLLWCFIFGVLIYICINWYVIYETYDNDLVLRNRFGYNFTLHSYFRKSKFYIHHTYLGMYLTFAIVCCFYFLKIYNQIFIKALLLFILIVFIINFPLLASKISLFVLFFSLMSFTLFNNKFHKKTLSTLFLFSLVLVFIGFIIFNDWVKILFERSIGERLYLWSIAIEEIKNNYIIGVGTGDVLDTLNETYSMEYKDYYPHNSSFVFFLRFGVIGLFTLIAFYFILIKKAIKHDNSLLFTFTLIVFISSLTEHIYERHIGILFIIFFFSILYNYLDETDTI
ncbi:O-antigen ligase family protein [Hyunsoonleella sp. 2307UL5-6]|uniref:O-antigen ligase family protein n=1 Tax=Hyunsoonleella sp. 2307UL5-6 TaxID=3384768 RepID=UPI0039BCA936